MPLFNVTLERGQSAASKNAIRGKIMNGMGKLCGFDPGFVVVLFTELDKSDISVNKAFTEVYISEGRPDIFKDTLAEFTTDAICSETGWESSDVAIMIYDLKKGSVAVNGRVANRERPAAEQVLREKGS